MEKEVFRELIETQLKSLKTIRQTEDNKYIKTAILLAEDRLELLEGVIDADDDDERKRLIHEWMGNEEPLEEDEDEEEEDIDSEDY